jgi:hypothetical protein
MRISRIGTLFLLLLVCATAFAGWDYGLRPSGEYSATIVAKKANILTKVSNYLASHDYDFVHSAPASLGVAYGIVLEGEYAACIAFLDQDLCDEIIHFFQSEGTDCSRVITVVDTTVPD